MTDEEIKTKRLSDWKPETDIKLQKAFGKFVEESGELLEAIEAYDFGYDDEFIGEKVLHDLENELADVLAFITVIQEVTNVPRDWIQIDSVPGYDFGRILTRDNRLTLLNKHLGMTLSIVGRCQIQGVAGSNPDSKDKNTTVLAVRLYDLYKLICLVANDMGLNIGRIYSRKNAKIESKLPWVMGTATDLLPDPQ